MKSIKYSLFTKFLCWLLSVILFIFSFTVISKIIIGVCVFGLDAFSNEKHIEFYSTEIFKSEFSQDFHNSVNIADKNERDFNKNMTKYKEQTVDEVYNEFLAAKANIIAEELYYAVNNWDADYYQYEESVNDIGDNEETTSVSVTINNISDKAFKLPDDAGKYITVPQYAPENIKVASYALNTANGTEFLKYEALVREEAFDGEFITDKEVDKSYGYSFGVYYSLSNVDAKAEIERIYDSQTNEIYNSFHDFEYIKNYMESSALNLKYYLVDFDGEVTSNIDEIPSNLSNKSHYILANGANIKVKGFEDENFTDSLKERQVKTLCIFFDESFNENDVYGKLYKMYGVAKEQNIKMLCIELAATLIMCLIFLIIWLKLIGKRPSGENGKTYFIDKIPNDIHFLLSFGIIAGLTFGIVTLWLYEFSGVFLYSTLLLEWEALLSFTYIGLVFCVFTEWLSSVIRIKRAGRKYFKNTLIYKVFRLIKKIILRLVKSFGYKPKAVKIRFAVIFALYFLVNAALIIIGFVFLWDFPLATIFIAFAIVAFNIVVGYFTGEYVNTLDKIIVASSECEDVVFVDYSTPRSLKMLADNLSVKNKSIDKAVAQAIKNEQMKTQLITNVSHDLKTPLTSLINYSDLLAKCELDNEEATKYVEVINQKSDKLKHLIEDLIEASKASTGNVVFNKTKLNLCELAVQAIVEYTPDLEKNYNTIRFNEPAQAPIVFADGTKTYRIISNLLSNVKKYSAPDTRVYVKVYEEGSYGCFEIKNISKDPLDINPEQLTERFVRGDESRTNDGNGLGLAIANDLCTLQGGCLELKIDGDLFKATVKLPLSE